MEFYRIIEGLRVEDYEKLRKKQPNLYVYEENLLPSIKRKMDHLFLLDNFINSNEINTQFADIKVIIL